MDLQSVMITALVGVTAFLAANAFRGFGRADEKHEGAIARLRNELYTETSAIREEVKQIHVAVSALTAKLDSAPQYPGSGSFLTALREGLAIMESAKNLGIVRLA